MKLYLTADECYPVYTIREPSEYNYEPTVIELSSDEWFDYNRVESNYELWQTKLAGMYKQARKQTLLNNTKNGIKPKGFD